MKIPPDIRKCVVFIGLQKTNGEYVFFGTGLLISYRFSDKSPSYILTAKHVINGIKSKGVESVHIRVNLTTGESKWYKTGIQDWILHEDDNADVALLSSGMETTWNHLFLTINDYTLTPQIITENEIDVGEEVFVVGLFKHHHGNKLNVPIVRIGNISALNEEKIQTEHHLMDAYLIECRSIGGLSGSPVFINLGEQRVIKKPMVHNRIGQKFYLFGIIYGHYDSNISAIDIIQTDEQSKENDKVNTGIAIVTPVEKIIELLKTLNP